MTPLARVVKRTRHRGADGSAPHAPRTFRAAPLFDGKMTSMKTLVWITAASSLVAAPVSARTAPELYPIAIGAETARFTRGVPTVNLEFPDGAVQITPLPMEKGALSFDIAVYNKGFRPANLGIENVSIRVGPQFLPVMSYEALAEAAQADARRARIGTALVAGTLAAVSASSSDRRVYHDHVYTRRGVASRTIVWDDHRAGMAGAAVAVAGGAMVMNGIEQRLDYTMAQIDGQILRTTTVDPQASFGGRIVTAPLPRSLPPGNVHVTVRWNGRDYPFAFRLLAPGEMPPPFEPATP